MSLSALYPTGSLTCSRHSRCILLEGGPIGLYFMWKNRLLLFLEVVEGEEVVGVVAASGSSLFRSMERVCAFSKCESIADFL